MNEKRKVRETENKTERTGKEGERRKEKKVRGQKPNVSRRHGNQSSWGLHTEAQKAHEEVF